MNGLDIALLIVLGGSIIISFFRGGTKEIFSILAIILGMICASKLYPFGTKLISNCITNPNLANAVSFVLIFLLVCILVNLTGVLFRKMLHLLAIGWLDKLGGVIFGLLRGIILVSLIIIVLAKFPFSKSSKLLASSELLPYLQACIKAILVLLPRDFSSVIANLLK